MKRFQYHVEKGNVKRDIIWNMAGNLCNAAHSVLMLSCVSRFCGLDDAGIFSLAFSSSQIMYIIACFQLTNVLVTDARKVVGLYEAALFRLGTNILMLLVAYVFSTIQNFSTYQKQVFSLLVLYMLLLSCTELCECLFHREGYLYLAGKSLAGNILVNFVVFTVILYLSQDLCRAIACMCISVLVWILCFSFPYLRKLVIEKRMQKISGSAITYLLKMCVPLVCMQFIMSYIINSPKFAINELLTNREQSFYGYVMMPAACVNLLNLFALKPQMINLTHSWKDKDKKRFSSIVFGVLGWNCVVAICVLTGGYFLGIPLLSIFYGVDLKGMENILLVVLLGGCFYAVAVVFDAVATVMRCHQWNLLAYVPVFALSMFLPNIMTRKFGLTGAALSYAGLMLILALGSGFIIILFFRGTRMNGGSTKNNLS